MVCTLTSPESWERHHKRLISTSLEIGPRSAFSMSMNRSTALIGFTAAATIVAACFLPPIHQSQFYHRFAEHSTHFGIANFWNVTSNVPFLIVALAAWLRKSRKDICFQMLLIGIALTTFGSAFYHAQPSDARLVWDRLPMTIVFLCILTLTIADRVNPRLVHHLLWPLLAVGVLSVAYWRATGDLRPYVVVQFYPLIAIPLLLCLPNSTAAISLPAQWGMIAFYALAKIFELLDGRLATQVPAGAHAWKHVLAAIGLLLYTQTASKISLEGDA